MNDIISIQKWFKKTKENESVLICGPCSAETEEQVLNTAKGLSMLEGGIDIFRAGIWKPRTSPSKFQGVGIKGLDWLVKVKEIYKFPLAVEVALPIHVEECLKRKIDVLWIGARTTSNPFSTQEICEALKGVDIPILIKNPTNPDISLWIGAIERLLKFGNNKIAAVHRGFYPFEKNKYRNIPKWEIPIELKSIFPDLSIICDASHISGSKQYIEKTCQDALDLHMDGLMIEVHSNPTQALSDAKQQLTPEELIDLISCLKFRNEDISDKNFNHQLKLLRKQIDSIDTQLVDLLMQRMKIVDKIGHYKMDNNISILQIKRWAEILKTRTKLAEENQLDLEFINNMLKLIHEESIRIQKEIFKKK